MLMSETLLLLFNIYVFKVTFFNIFAVIYKPVVTASWIYTDSNRLMDIYSINMLQLNSAWQFKTPNQKGPI